MAGLRVVACVAIAALVLPSAAAQNPTPTLKELLQAYWDGDADVVSRHFTSGRDVDRMLPAVRAWIASKAADGWPIATSVLLIDLAAVAVRPPDPSPRTAIQLLTFGREQFVSRTAERDPRANRDLERLWHQTAVALLQGIGAFKEQQDVLDAIERRFSTDLPARFWLARGIALDQQAAQATGERTAKLLEDASRFYDRAARAPQTRAEASARAAFALIRLERHRDAMRRLDLAGETSDLPVAAWLPLLRSRALAALGEEADARLNAEAAAKLAASLGTRDPWTVLEYGDARMAPGWLPQLRAWIDATTSPSKATRPASFALLDQYERREYDEVVKSLLKLPSLETFAKEYTERWYEWLTDAGPAHVDRRRAVLAMVALEAARARGAAEWAHAYALLEWACALLRNQQVTRELERRENLREQPITTELERRWMHAAAALIEGAASGAALELHVAHALTRFPGDPPLVMARAVAAELRAGPDERAAGGTRPPDSVATIDHTFMADPLAVTVVRLTDAAKLPEYSREASLRLGYTALRRGQAQAALGHLTPTALPGTPPDPFIDYLVFLFRGRANERLRQWDEAAAEYRRAFEVVPTQSAELALAAALSRAGRRAEAAAIADRALARRDGPADPWLSYGQSDFRHWTALMDRLRMAIQ